MERRTMLPALFLLLVCFKDASAAAEISPDTLLSRELAEDPTLELTDNPLKRIQGSPKEIVTYRCEKACDKKPYKRVLLDKRGRVTYAKRPNIVIKYEYGNQHNMPILSKDDMWGDGRFSTTTYKRDKYGNKTHSVYSNAVRKVDYFEDGGRIQAKESSEEGETFTSTYKNGLLEGSVAVVMMENFRPDGSYYTERTKIINDYRYDYYEGGGLKRIERVVSSGSGSGLKVRETLIKYFNERGFLEAEIREFDRSVKAVEYINQKLDSFGNLIAYDRCNVAGTWGKYSGCETYKTTFTYYK